MRRWARASGRALLLGCVTACAGAPASETVLPIPAAPGPGPLGAEAAAARDAAVTFITAEAAGERADSLLVPGADFIMTGTAVIEAATTSLGGALAYVVVVYRFDARDPALDERARGTFVLEKQRAGWRIRHVHTSMVGRWER